MLLENNFNQQQRAAYRDMLKRRLRQRASTFSSELLLVNDLLQAGEVETACVELQPLLQSVSISPKAKPQLLNDWRSEITKLLAKNDPALANTLLQQTGTSLSEIDKAAKANTVDSVVEQPAQ